MTWYADRLENQPKGGERDKLLALRQKLVFQIEELQAMPMGKTQTAKNGRAEDLAKLAKKIINIDKKLGRTQ